MRTQVIAFPRLSADTRVAFALKLGSTTRLAEEIFAHARVGEIDAKSIARLSDVASGALIRLTDVTNARRCANHLLRGARHG